MYYPVLVGEDKASIFAHGAKVDVCYSLRSAQRKSSSRGSVFALINVSLLFLLFGKILEDAHRLMLMIRKYTFFI